MSHREFCWWPPTERYYLDFVTHSFPTKEGVTLKIIFKNINRLHWRFHVALVEPVGKMFNYVQWIRSLDNHRRQTVTTGGENALKASASLACLEIRYEMRRRFYTEQDWLPKSFSLPTLSTVENSSGYLLFISSSTICFWIDLIRVLATTGNTSAVPGYTRV